MVEAYVLIQTVVGRTHSIAREIDAIEGVDRAEPVAGPYDMIARLSAGDFDSLQQVEYQIELVDGVTRTLTCVIGKF
jgi:thiamine pyrophosphokinase